MPAYLYAVELRLRHPRRRRVPDLHQLNITVVIQSFDARNFVDLRDVCIIPPIRSPWPDVEYFRSLARLTVSRQVPLLPVLLIVNGRRSSPNGRDTSR